MTLAVRGVFRVIAYLGVVLAPLVFAVIGASQPDHGFWTDFSIALGFVGLAMMGLEFALVARFGHWRRLSARTRCCSSTARSATSGWRSS